MELNEQHTTVNIVKFFKFSEEQRLVLRDFYAKNHYPNKQEIENLSNQFGCTKKQINSWFTNTRQVMRRRNDKKSEDSNNLDDENLESSSEECEWRVFVFLKFNVSPAFFNSTISNSVIRQISFKLLPYSKI